MSELRDVGIICINGKIKGVCQNCLWLEWDHTLNKCVNQGTSVCRRHWSNKRTSPTDQEVLKVAGT
ncbi:MAG: hypothetical protein BZ151_08010 [Desulfobacca sp. 4484_104]|nr:MAG: hypothetical protein BZ151_08010 [Desulfobacca sp. 4484_104]RLA89340.1 MAG: hypothetical protein DRG58_05460 [Deltaproteobacteria bacterium]